MLRSLSGVLSVLIAVIALSCADKDGLDVKTPYGIYRGHVIKSRGGRDILSFKGIPYAKPPVGALRFKEAVKPDKGDSVLEANKEYVCLQRPLLLGRERKNDTGEKKFIGTEDCLYLNVYRPKEVPLNKLLPVYFWVHDGGFFAGSGSESWVGPRLYLDGQRDLVLVTINYRLGVLGFLSANDVNLPGNLGLKDQNFALKWVHENIKLFGGDPNSVTLGGLSAGSAGVSLHLHSKASRGLFHRAVSQSGTVDCPWAKKTSEEAWKIGSKLISHLGCPSEPNELLKCLQGLPAETVLSSDEALKTDKIAMIMHVTPVIEKDSPTAFMTEESIAAGSDVPLLTGVTDAEGLLFYRYLWLEDPNYLDLSILKNDYKKILPVIAYYGPHHNLDALTEELKNFYFGDEEFSLDSARHFVDLLSDFIFNRGLILTARKHKGKVYMYCFSYRGKHTITAVRRPKGLENGVSHADEFMYMYNADFGTEVKLEGKDLEMSNTLLKMWYNFIVTGDPTPEDHFWEESDGGKKYMNFTNNGPVMSSYLFKERIEFLDNIDKTMKFRDEL